ncbi:TonB-dependent hemoglobin/transferrin/lactoferrin family receptor [Paenochrobactrum sp. BZR 588]|uniref:TonB-dependent receptor n=1 Tax=unclassified Paenochrobactrum TaxID=2639760 RepID=UPI003853EDBA
MMEYTQLTGKVLTAQHTCLTQPTSRKLACLMAALMMTTSLSVVMKPAIAVAQSTNNERHFTIPAQSLSTALLAFSNASGVDIFFDQNDIGTRTTSGLNGRYTAQAGLARLLAGTGLRYHFTNANSVTISDRVSNSHDTAARVNDGSILLDTITVHGQVQPENAPYMTAGSTAYVSAEDLSRLPSSSQGDLFKSTPGVVSAGSRSGQGLNINIRGLQGMNRVATLIDGTQQSTSSYTGYRGQTSSVFVDPDLIAGIDITKGPSDGPLGNGAMGGVVNMRTLNARDVVAEGKEYGAQIKATMGSNTKTPPAVNTYEQLKDAPSFLNGDSFNGSIAAATVQDNYEFLAAVTRRKTGNYFAGKKGGKLLADDTGALSPVPPGGEVFNTSEDSFSVLLKGKAHFNEDTSLELSYMRYENKHGELDDFPYVYGFIPPSQKDLNRRKVDTLTAKLAHNPSDNPYIDLHVSSWLTNVKREAPISLEGSADVKTYGVEIYNNSSIETALGHLALTYGAQISLEDSDGDELYDSYSWDPSQTYLISAGPTGKRRLASVFSRANYDVTDWLSFGAGLRYDTYKIEQGGGALAHYGDKNGSRLNPSLSVTVTPWEGIQFYGHYAQGWRPPALRETSFQLGTILYPNPDLKPEKAENYEAGINVMRTDIFTDGDNLRVKASYFHNKYKDYIIRDSIAQNWSEPRHWANIPSATFEGLELSVKYDTQRIFIETGLTRYSKVEFCHQLTGCDSKAIGIDYGSNYIPPKYLLTLSGGVHMFEQKLTVGARATFIGERALSESMGLGYVTPTLWPKRTIVDLFGNYKFNETVSLNFNVENLTNQYYLDPLSFTRAPAPGRTIRAGLTAKF